jgi:MoxR-like ATPase
MSIKINSKELLEVLDFTPSNQNILIVGKHGIGKSQVISNFYNKKGIKVITLFLGQMSDPGDLIGLPYKDDLSGVTNFLPPYWFPTNNEPIVLFLDELNRARPEILQSVMDLTLNRSLAGKNLPTGSFVISAINEGEEYQLTELDPALISRFNVYHFNPGVNEWLLWASKIGLDNRIISFIEENSDYLDSQDSNQNTSNLDKSPDRRAWKRVSEILKNIDVTSKTSKKIIAGIIGVRAAARFWDHLSENKLLTAKLILKNFSKHESILNKYQITEMCIVNENIYRFLDIQDFVVSEKEKIIENLKQFINWLYSLKSTEVTAHFTSIFENATYPQANYFLMIETPEVYKKIQQFIKHL